MEGKLIQLDSRGRIALGKMAEDTYYMANRDDDTGIITLVPVVLRPVTDLIRGVDNEQR